MRTPIAMIASKGWVDVEDCAADLLRSDVEDDSKSAALITLVEAAP